MKNLQFTLLLILLLGISECFSQIASDSTKTITTSTGEFQEILVLEDQEIESNPQIDSLEQKLEALEEKLISFLTIRAEDESEQYSKNYNNFTNAVTIINEVNKTYDAISNDRLSAEAYNILISINNPESGALGFKFTNVVLESVETQLNNVKDLKSKDKKIFIQGITTLVNGVASLINPTGMIGSVIQFISGYVPSRLKTALKDPLGEDFINNFKTSIKNYRIYYATLDRYNGLFNEDLSNLDSKHSNLKHDIDVYINQNLEPTGINLNQPLAVQINDIFDFSNSGISSFDHAAINNKSEINKVISSLGDLKDLVNQLNKYYSDYTQIVNSNFNRNIQLLQKAEELPEANADKIVALKTKLIELRDGKNEDGVVVQKGFKSKFEVNITQIGNSLTAIK